MKKIAMLLASLLWCFPALGQESVSEKLERAIQERRELSKSGVFLQQPSSGSSTKASASALAQAIDLDPSVVTASSVSGASEASAVFSSLGIIEPLRGSTFAMLSTGVAGTPLPEPGTDLIGEDRTTLSVTIDVPSGPGHLSFHFNFLSTEYPEWIGTAFNDTFTATLTDAQGTRVIASASVNSSTFFPASTTRAAGSGFDLFTADPGDIDVVFGATGLPDAGLTDFQLVEAPFESAGQITIELSIADLGDAILDSAVLLDNFSLGTVEIVDVIPHFYTGGHFVTNPESLLQAGQTRTGAATDGITRVLLRASVAGPGNATFSLDGGQAPADGGFDAVGGSGRRAAVTVPAVSTSQGYMAFAVYRVPDRFNRGGDQNRTERFVDFRFEFNPAGGGSGSHSQVSFKLVRPPLVFVHGLWSDRSKWTFPLVSDSRFPVKELVDYQETNASRFAVNAGKVHKSIEKALSRCRENGTAATQADVIGHSMGGLLSRIRVMASNYHNAENYNRGDVHKLITLDSPHTGTPLANLAILIRERPYSGLLFALLLRFLEKPIDDGAIDDLGKGSVAIASIGAARVPSHALVGIGGSDWLAEEAPGSLGAFYTVVNEFADTTGNDLFEGLQHDFVVGRLSQEGGVPGSAQSVFGRPDGSHFRNISSTAYSNRLVELLDMSATSSAFAEFPAPATLSAATFDPVALKAAVRPFKSVQDGLRITSPAPNTVVTAGEEVRVVVEPTAGSSVDRVLLVAPMSAMVDDAFPFVFDLEIPAEAIGGFELMAAGSNAAGDLFSSDEVPLWVDAPSSLDSLSVIPEDPLLLGIGDTVQLYVLGEYHDGVTREITDPEMGTEYVSLDPDIVAVSAAGGLTATGEGITTILVRNGAVQESITATVLTDGQGSCGGDGPSLCLNQSRFRVEVEWRDFQGNTGSGSVVPGGSDNSGLFWFFEPDNWEMLIKVLDGCGVNGHFWVFAAATTNVEYTLRVTDTVINASKSYVNPLGNAAAALTDTGFFSCSGKASETGSPMEAVAQLDPMRAEGTSVSPWRAAVSRKKGISSKADMVLNPKACVTNTISCNATQSGSLTTDDCPLEDGTYVDFWEFSGSSGTDVVITASSGNFDTLLFLLDPTMAVVAMDDDSGPGTNSRIEYRLTSSGTWTIAVNNYWEWERGGYSLTLSCSGSGSTPEAPSNLTATALSSSAIELSWRDNSDNETEFRIERKTTGAFQDIGSADADSTGKVVQGLQAGTTYTFRVRARNQHGDSGYSNQASATTSAIPQACTPGAANLCLNGSRFKVEVSWRDFQGNTGQAQVVPLGSDDSGLFWFFEAANWEMLVKVLDGCGVNGHFWVFAAATTTVEYTLQVSDSVTGSVTEYRNPLGTAADAITDTGAFAVCP